MQGSAEIKYRFYADVGQRLHQLFSYIKAGFFFCLKGKNTSNEPGDTHIIGNDTRRYQYGIRGGAAWKGISLSFILQGVGKRDLWLMNELFYHITMLTQLCLTLN